MSLLPQLQDDEEWLARLIADAQAIESFSSSLFIERFLNDHDTSRYSDWVERAQACGFVVPRDISYIQQHASSTSTQTPLPARLTEPFVQAITLLLNITRETAVELTTTTLATSSVDIAEDEFEAGLELVLKIVECYHRQRIARLGLLAELLRLAQASNEQQTSHHPPSSSSTATKVKQILQQLDPHNLFAILLSAAVPNDDDDDDDSSSSTSLSRPQREALQALPRLASFASFVANFMQIQNIFQKQLQNKAMEALIGLCYEHVTVQRAHLILVSVACPETTKNNLVGIWGVEGLALWRDTKDHPLLQGAQAHDELRALAKLWQRQCLLSKPFTLMVMGLGLLFQAAQLTDSTALLETANDQDAFGYLYEVLTELIPARSSFHDDDDDDNYEEELDAASLMYAGIGREVVSAAITAFSHNLGNTDNVDIFSLLAATVTQNSPMMTQQFWVDWGVYTKTSEERPLCVLLERAHQLAQQNKFVPFLRLMASIISTPESVRVVLDDFVPPHLFSQALQAKGQNEDELVVLLESIHALAQRATTAATRQTLCQALDPKLLWQVVLQCSSERAGAAGMEALSLLLQDNAVWTQAIASSFHWIVDEVWHTVVFRGNLTARSAALFLSSLFRNMTSLFFAPNGNGSFIVDFLGYFRHALMTVASLLSSSVPMLSKPVLVGQTQLTYRSAIAIMDCIRTTLQYAGPIEALHSSITVCRAAADFRWSIVTSIPCKAILYYATVPVSLGIARLLDEGVRDAQLFQIKNKADPFQNWLSSAKQDSSSDPSLQFIVSEALENPGLLSFDFSDVCFQQGDTAKMPLQAASSAIDLLQVWAGVLESKQQRDFNAVVTECPHVLLSAKGDLPQLNTTTSRVVSAVWNAAAISYAGFFARYFQCETTGDVEASISEKAMELLATFAKHAANQSDDAFFRTIFESKCLTESLAIQIESALGSIGASKQKNVTSCFSILANCASFSPHEAGQILSSKSSWKTIIFTIQKVCTDTVARKQSGTTFTPMLPDIAIAKSSLNLVLSFHKASSRIGMHEQIDIHSGFLRELLAFLSACAPSKEDDDDAAGILSEFRQLALDFIGHELSISQTLEINEREKKLIADFESVFGRDLSDLISLSTHYLQLRHLDSLHQVYDRYFGTYGNAAGKSIVSTLGYFFEKSNRHGLESIDTRFASAWLDFLQPDKSRSLNELTSTYSQFLGEISLLMSWKSVITTLAVLEESKWRNSEQSEVLSMAMKRETLVTMLRTLDIVERIQPHSLVLDVYQDVVARLSFIPLHSAPKNENWIDVISLVAECCKKIVKSHLPVDDLLTTVEHLLASSAVILNAARPSYEEVTVVEVCISLAEVVCQIVRMIENDRSSSGHQRSHLGCLSVCIAVLAALTPSQGSLGMPWGGQSGFIARMYALFKDCNVIQSLSLQISTPTANDDHSSSHSLRSRCDTILMVLAFFSKIAVVGEADLLSLLVESELALLLPKRTQFSMHSEDSFPMRGYVDSQLDSAGGEKHGMNTSSLERGVDNPHHKVWRSSIKFVATALRSAANKNCDPATRMKYRCLALDFLSANTATILSCLKQCSSIYFNQDYPVLTMNALEEASLILSLASELCSKTSLEIFQGKYGDLYNTFLDFSKSILASLSCFIGSSAASRDLFGCIDKMEDADTMALDSIPHLADLGRMFFTLAGGISNARHEAIRYSHFVSRCSAPVTPDDVAAQGSFPPGYQLDERLRTNSDPHSLHSLERKCREAVTNSFSFELEIQAAQALFHAVQILWRTHPTASSLVMLSEKETQQFNTVPIIKEGTQIAVRVDPQPLHSSSNSISLVEVVRCDTVNRRWEVCSWQDDIPVYSVVTHKQIVGIEDSTLRRGVLLSAPALRSSAELEKSVGEASIGHLILVLRWCGHYEDLLGMDNLVAKRLAELCTFLLATEVTVHREWGTLASAEILSLQLMDLYGEKFEFSTLLEDFSGPLVDGQKGQLQTVLSEDLWSWARQQLHEEIQQATGHLKDHAPGRFSVTSPRYSPRKSAVRALGY